MGTRPTPERWERATHWPLMAAAVAFLVAYAWPILDPGLPAAAVRAAEVDDVGRLAALRRGLPGPAVALPVAVGLRPRPPARARRRGAAAAAPARPAAGGRDPVGAAARGPLEPARPHRHLRGRRDRAARRGVGAVGARGRAGAPRGHHHHLRRGPVVGGDHREQRRLRRPGARDRPRVASPRPGSWWPASGCWASSRRRSPRGWSSRSRCTTRPSSGSGRPAGPRSRSSAGRSSG